MASMKTTQVFSDLGNKFPSSSLNPTGLLPLCLALDRLSDAIFIINEFSKFQFVNREACRILGYTRDELLELQLTDIDPGFPKDHWNTHWTNIKNGTLFTIESQHRAKDGHLIPVEISSSHFVCDGQDFHLAIAKDITERKRADLELAQMEAQLWQARKMESLGTLAGGLAHDMNNVLSAILAIASFNLETQPADDSTRQAFDTILRAAARGGKVVKGLLTFAHQNQLEEQDLDLNLIVQDVVHLLEYSVLTEVHLELALASGLRPIRGDYSALTHALMNLMVNSVDAMPPDGCLTVRTRNLDGGGVEVSVADTGSGMTKAVLDRALEPFFTTKPVGKGTGLGLSMVYSTVKAHKGRMEIQSEPGQGTCVKLRFPAGAKPG